jgi:hypothetical protein
MKRGQPEMPSSNWMPTTKTETSLDHAIVRYAASETGKKPMARVWDRMFWINGGCHVLFLIALLAALLRS